MKTTLKIPAVLALLFILVFTQAAGYYCSRSFMVLSLSLLAFVCSFDILIAYAKIQELKFQNLDIKNLKNSELKSAALNSAVIIFFSILVLSKLFKALEIAQFSFNVESAQKFILISAGIFILCSFIVFDYKQLFRKVAFCFVLSSSAMFCISIVSKTRNLILDLYSSFSLVVIVLTWSILIIIRAIKNGR